MRHRHQILILAGVLATCSVLLAQDGEGAKPLPLGGFDNKGSVTLGYRFTDVKGYRPMYQQVVNMQDGFRLMDFNLFGDSQEGANPFADNYSLSMSGLGGDPFPSAQLSVRRTNLFDFRANWRQSYYYWNQNDNVLLPITSVANVSKGLTTGHDWAMVRKQGSADMTLHATNALRFTFNVFRGTNNGTTYTTRSLYFFNPPSSWGGFARANPYYLYAPHNDNTNRFTGGIDYSTRSWNFHYRLGYQTFNEDTALDNASSPESSFNGLASTAGLTLTNLSTSTLRRLTTPVSELSFLGKPHRKLDWRGGYIFTRYQGPASLDESFQGIGPTVAAGPYSVSQAIRVHVTGPNHVVSQGFTYHIARWWDLNTDYRYSHFTSESAGQYHSLFNGTTASNGTVETDWRDGVSDLDVNMVFTPVNSLVFRPGVRLMKADITSLEDGVVDIAHTRRIKTVWPQFSFGYQPSTKFNFRGSFHSATSGASYTSISPHTRVGTHLITRYQPVRALSFENDLYIVNNKLLDSSYEAKTHSNSTTLYYAWNDRFSFFGGFSYSSYFATGRILYARGTPLTSTLRNQEVTRVWQTGIEAGPWKRAGMRFTFNFDRSTGVGQIAGEPPAYGPLSWPLGTGTVYYNFPKAGRLSIDLQRTYYREEIVTANNFSANLLTIRWTRDF